MFKSTLSRYIPNNSQAEYFADANAVVYRYTNERNQACAVGYRGKRTDCDFHFTYHSEAIRQQAIERWLQPLKERQTYKNALAAKRKAFKHSLKVGDILVSSWGYDQTNVDFYEVVALKGDKSIFAREISATVVQTGFMSGQSDPVKGDYCGEPLLRRVTEGNSVRINGSSIARPWNGKSQSTTWYA